MTIDSGVRRIVVGVDGSAESVAALRWACREASLRAAEVLAVLALESACHQVASYAVPAPRQAGGSWGAARDVLRRSVSEALSLFPGVSVRTEIAEGLAARVLLDQAADADMLVLGRISHGLPRPGNLDAAREFEAILAGQGVTAATIALVDGVPRVGLAPDELERIATDESVVKVSSRDIAIAMARKVTGGTTVAATSVLAARAGIRVFATGGLGGVHRGASETFDESADLTVLSRTPITVVSAGVKSILDIPATLERLETLGVAVVGYRTSRFPAFWLSDSGYDLDWRADTP